MSIFAGIFSGVLVGLYFAEKNVPFPVTYHERPQGHTGFLTLDLQIIDTISQDVKDAVGYGVVKSPPSSQ